MRSRAAMKFNSRHPDSHLQFQTILASAKLQMTSPGPTSGEMSDEVSDEVSNTRRNKFLTRATAEDRLMLDRQKRSKLSKRITWSPTLVEVEDVIGLTFSGDHLEREE